MYYFTFHTKEYSLIKNTSLFIFAFFITIWFAPVSAVAAEGDLLWSKTENPSTGSDQAFDVVTDSSGNNYTVGFDNPPGNIWPRIEKRDADGNLLWTRRSGEREAFFAKIVMDDTGIYSAGTGMVCSGSCWVMEKRDFNGNLIWSKKTDPSNDADPFSDIAINNSGFYITGNKKTGCTFGGFPAAAYGVRHLEKRDLSDGALIWQRDSSVCHYYINDRLGYYNFLAADDSGVYVTGTAMSAATMPAEIEKFDSNGNSLWRKESLYGKNSGIYSALESDGQGGLYLSGVYSTAGAYTSEQILEKRYADTGNLDFYRSISTGPPEYRVTTDLNVRDYGLFMVDTYYPNYLANESSVIIEKRDLDANIIWSKTSSPNPYVKSFGLYADDNSVYLVGQFASSISPYYALWYLEKRANATPANCGAADTVPTVSAPTPSPAVPPNNLCTAGSAPVVTDSGASFDWTCDGADGIDSTADDVSCSAPEIVPPSISLSATGCYIAIGSSSCDGDFSWSFNDSSPEYNVTNTTNGLRYGDTITGNNVPGALNYGVNDIVATDGLGTMESRSVNAVCVSGSVWNSSVCKISPLPPAVTVSANPRFIRSGEVATINVEVDSATGLNCSILNAENTAIYFDHSGVPANKIYSYDTRELNFTQIVTVKCTDTTTGLIGVGEARVEIISTMQEV